MRDSILPKLKQNSLKNQDDQLQLHSDWTACLDGWTDCSGNSIYAVMMIDGETQHYIGNMNLGVQLHTADVLCRELMNLLGQRVHSLKAIVTDSPNVMVRLRKDFCLINPWVVDLKCCLHVINLIIKDFVNFSLVKPWVSEISRLVNFFMSSGSWRVLLKKWADENGCGIFIRTYTAIRWYSFVGCCMSVQGLKKGFKYCLQYEADNPGGPKLPNDIKIIIKDSNIFANLNYLIQILRPFTKAIAILERKDSHLGEVWISLFTIHKYLMSLDRTLFPNKFNKLHSFLLDRLQVRENGFMEDVYLVAFYLCPPYRRICVSGTVKVADIHTKTLDMARKWLQIPMNATDAFRKEIQDYHLNISPHHSHEKDPRKYWSQFPLSYLGKLATILFKLCPSAASVERLFSKLSRSKTKFRNKMLPDNLASHGIINLEVLNEFQTKVNPEIDITTEMEWEDVMNIEELMSYIENDENEFLGNEEDVPDEYDGRNAIFNWAMDIFYQVPVPVQNDQVNDNYDSASVFSGSFYDEYELMD